MALILVVGLAADLISWFGADGSRCRPTAQ